MTDQLDRLKAALADRYTIEREIGSGGMATVYLAQDLKHDREVAVKVLRPELSAVLGGERFLREIRIAAKLNHPHILALYDSGEAEGFLYYVMPHVAGESLRSKLNREKQLPIDETIALTQQVAAALDYAHEAGVIHRDIKPENVLLHQGEALVADFGIALAVSAAGGTRLTDTGLSLGTPEYMSPEQATGERELDARSDVYSLGAVTYEMLVGDPPHTGSTVQAIIAKVVSVTPQPIAHVRDTVPNNVEAAVQCALAKIPADRFASGAEFADALTNPTFALPTAAGVAAARQHEWPWRPVALAATVVAAVLAVTTLWGWLRSPPTPLTPVARVRLPVPDGEEIGWERGRVITMSPDGSRLVYVGRAGTQLWLRSLDELHATPVPGTEGARAPFFSIDGQLIAFQDGGSGALRVVSTTGSPPVTLVEQTGSIAGDWGPDGMVYFGSLAGGISRVPASGGEAEVVTRPDTLRGVLLHSTVDVLPNGKGALLTIWRGQPNDADIAVVELETGAVRVLGRGMDPLYAASGHVVYVREDGVVLAAPFDQDQMELTGSATSLTETVVHRSYRASEFSLAGTGTLLLIVPFEYRVQPVWVDRAGSAQVIDPNWVGSFYFPALSPDGTRIAMSVDGPDGRHIWIKTLDRGPLSRLTFDGSYNQPSAWTPDGRSVMFGSRRARPDPYDLWEKRADGSGEATLVLDVGDDRDAQAPVWSKDKRWLVYQWGRGGDADIYGYQPDTEALPIPLVDTEFSERAPVLSPDGRWLAYTSNESGRFEVYVRPFPNAAAARWQVSTAGGRNPLWAHSGRELFCLNGRDELVAVEFATEPTFRTLTEHSLFSVAGYRLWAVNHSYAVDVDDQRFVMLRLVEGGTRELWLVFNFFEELKQRVGSGND
jgi:serine/threonine-protein kinase